MSNSKFLSDKAWKDLASKNKVKDNGLLKALADYRRLDDDEHDEVLECLEEIVKLGAKLQKAKDVAAEASVVEYLSDLLDAAESDQRVVTKAKAEADKEAKAEAAKKAKAEAAAKKQEQEDDKAAKDDDEEDEDDHDPGGSLERLALALKNMKTSRTPYHFLVCDAKPYGLVLSKKSIKTSGKHKKELAEMAGGNTRQPKFGTCLMDGNQLILEMDKPVAGLGRVLEKWLKANLSRPIKVTFAGESAAEDEG